MDKLTKLEQLKAMLHEAELIINEAERIIDTQSKRIKELEGRLATMPDGYDSVFMAKNRPQDRQQVTYYFEPFSKWYTGIYYAEGDSVIGANGFTTWLPEVTLWVVNSTNKAPKYKAQRDELLAALKQISSVWSVETHALAEQAIANAEGGK